MFERFTEDARRVIFFARYEAALSGSAEIGTIHLLLGILREETKALRALLDDASLAALHAQLVTTAPASRSRISSSVDLPLSMASKRILSEAASESDRLADGYIGTKHLLLALFRDPATSTYFQAHGIDREKLLTLPAPVAPLRSDGDVRTRLYRIVGSLPPELLLPAEKALKSLVGNGDAERGDASSGT